MELRDWVELMTYNPHKSL